MQEQILNEAFVYGLLLIIGGIIGFTKSNSKPSLIMGTVTGLVAILFCWIGWHKDTMLAFFLLAAESILLTAFFYMRYSATRKFMPGGLMMVISAISFVTYCTGICVA